MKVVKFARRHTAGPDRGVNMLLRSKTLLMVAILLYVSWIASAQSPSYDLVLRNARIVDGSGRGAYPGDVAIRGDTILQIARAITEQSKRVIDVGGQVLAPGFIDVHSHGRYGIVTLPSADNVVRQGVTTVIEGPDGNSPVPLAPFLKRIEALRKTINFGTFIGQGSIRSAAMGRENRPPTTAELDKMRVLVEQGMKEGAFGLSSGLSYVPGVYATTAEIVEVAKVAGRLGGHYQSHIRGEGGSVVKAVREAIEVGEMGHLPTQVTHHKVVGKENFGQSVETLRLIDAARARGVDVTIDQYPYTSIGGDIESTLFRSWVLEGSREDILARLHNPIERARIKAESIQIIRGGSMRGDLTKVVLSQCPFDRSLAGKTLADIARVRGLRPDAEGGAEAAMWLLEQGGCGRVGRDLLSESDVERIMRHRYTMIASDGGIIVGVGTERAGLPHPRSYGTFPRVLAVYARDRKALVLEDAVRKMTSLPAQRLGLKDRGTIAVGMKADLVVFDPSRVRDTATFENPHQYPEGIPIVIVNGEIVFENGAITTARPGKVLYGPAKASTTTP
jgi:N-acyl-D-amino-acid deacylase